MRSKGRKPPTNGREVKGMRKTTTKGEVNVYLVWKGAFSTDDVLIATFKNKKWAQTFIDANKNRFEAVLEMREV